MTRTQEIIQDHINEDAYGLSVIWKGGAGIEAILEVFKGLELDPKTTIILLRALTAVYGPAVPIEEIAYTDAVIDRTIQWMIEKEKDTL